jgi:excisionase family DNA binding protein
MGRHQGTAPEALTRHMDEAARLIGVSEDTLWRMVQRKQIRSIKVAGRRLVPYAEIERLLAQVS